jgi:hypothetical protein
MPQPQAAASRHSLISPADDAAGVTVTVTLERLFEMSHTELANV